MFHTGLTDDGQKANKIQHTQLGLLITLHSMTGTFSRNVQHLLSAIEAEDLVNALRAIYSPYEGYKERLLNVILTLFPHAMLYVCVNILFMGISVWNCNHLQGV